MSYLPVTDKERFKDSVFKWDWNLSSQTNYLFHILHLCMCALWCVCVNVWFDMCCVHAYSMMCVHMHMCHMMCACMCALWCVCVFVCAVWWYACMCAVWCVCACVQYDVCACLQYDMCVCACMCEDTNVGTPVLVFRSWHLVSFSISLHLMCWGLFLKPEFIELTYIFSSSSYPAINPRLDLTSNGMAHGLHICLVFMWLPRPKLWTSCF